MVSGVLPSYRFGPFLVDRPRYRVLRGHEPLDLSPKLLDLLVHLVEHRDELVTKDALLDALWAAANVTENALAQAISELRQALDDDAQAPQYIKTVARRGYRFVAPVEEVVGSLSPSPAASVPLGGEGPPGVAVMNFTNVTGDAQVSWLSAGIAETVAADLRALGRFRVIDRSRVVEGTRATGGSLHELATYLQTPLVVTGSYQQTGDRIRITARLVDVRQGEVLADAKIDGPLTSIFELQDLIVGQLSRTSPAASTVAALARSGTRETANLDAYRAFTEGWLKIESLDLDELRTAVGHFARAIAIDPGYAPAHTGLASAKYALFQETRTDNEPDDALLQESIAHARQAVALDPGLAEAHATLSMALVSAWNTPEAAAAARRAVALEPSHWRHLFRLAYASWGEARLTAAAGALALYPDFAFSHFQMAMVYVARAHLAQAEAVLLEGLAMQERQARRQARFPALGLEWLRGIVRLAQDDVEGAVAAFDREEALARPGLLYAREFVTNARYGRGCAWLRAGRPADAERALRLALEIMPGHGHSRIALSQAITAQGRNAEAQAELEAADRTRDLLQRTRPVDASLMRALRLVASNRVGEGLDELTTLLSTAPPGFAGWTIPAEPILRQVAQDERVVPILRRLAERAR